MRKGSYKHNQNFNNQRQDKLNLSCKKIDTLMAVLPEYLKNGTNGTTMIYKTSKNDKNKKHDKGDSSNQEHMPDKISHPIHREVLHISYRTAMDKLLKFNCQSWKSLKACYGKMLRSPNKVPVPMNKNTILIQAKTRDTLKSSKDGAMGSISCQHITALQREGNTTIITFESGWQLQVFQQLETVKNNIIDGYLILYNYNQRLYPNTSNTPFKADHGHFSDYAHENFIWPGDDFTHNQRDLQEELQGSNHLKGEVGKGEDLGKEPDSISVIYAIRDLVNNLIIH
ncbi:hypothetical protein [Natranaerobius thermophilus]|uniref:Uncharacterized protein n=1 Tax=Natranaerobius thermophilus (strain ATCC BAA-1301 / DSM 18059 / JW/NM-WN-LF) TaxID=457570 RepID=B2A1R1_NATTJ|nr:hypothetical protein [Natranaerobius thermophilus]ACB86108.1 hypothetical protein Nther_2549 [Natranaerobius thermophilus JW/NM-WN-LF]